MHFQSTAPCRLCKVVDCNHRRDQGAWITRSCDHCGRDYRASVAIMRTPGRGLWCRRECANKARLTPPETRVWALVENRGPDDCWPWLAARDSDGYGLFAVSHRQQMGAHRYILGLKLGRPVPDGVMALHTCDWPPCCNPAHLYEGTALDNARDCKVRERGCRGERHSRAKLTADDVRDIRRLYATGGWSQDTLARMYGVTQQAIGAVVRGETWKHVA
jgi:hypothetical protein